MPRLLVLACCVFFLASVSFAGPAGSPDIPNIFRPASTPADSILGLSHLVLAITGIIFVVVFTLMAYVVVKFRRRGGDDGREPPQVYGSNQVELAWTVIPVLIVLVLFLATARVLLSIQDAPQPPGAIEVVAIGHQYWWEYRYPALGVVTANELHVPVSDPAHPTPTFLTLLSADTDHSFWVPQLAGKTDLIPNHPNHTWIDPHSTGLYVGQCAQYCGVQHAKMLLRVYVDSRADFDRWIQQEKASAVTANSSTDAVVQQGRSIFESTACINCHAVSGTVANGRFGPDLTHLMSRDTIAAGAASNTHDNLRAWIQNPDSIKPGSLMPAMNLTKSDLDAVTAYLETLR
ncbi:MAG TPA: cytochrome c oxidase subunit II [Candidatus Acidoferrales bacterium]